MEFPNLLGLVAGFLTTVAFVPQVVKTWRSRSTEDISLGMFALFSVGVGLWVFYGVLIGSRPVFFTNLATLGLALVLLYLKLRYK